MIYPLLAQKVAEGKVRPFATVYPNSDQGHGLDSFLKDMAEITNFSVA